LSVRKSFSSAKIFSFSKCKTLMAYKNNIGGMKDFAIPDYILLGGELLTTYNSLLNKNQVAGGDGTASWIIGVVADLKLHRPPPVATVPLGTGNNIPFSFGWGRKNPATDKEAVMSFLNQVKDAKELKIDSWHVIMKTPKECSCEHIAPVESDMFSILHQHQLPFPPNTNG
ncbi:hypothetical protein S83_069974, partial [Arachis hypogaea]